MRTLLALIVSLFALIFAASCSDKKVGETKQEAPEQLAAPDSLGIRAADFIWGVQKHPMVAFYFQPTDSLRQFAPDLLKKALEIYEFNCQMLMWKAPEPVDFYCYSSPAELERYTSRREAFSVGNKIYYGFGPPYGRPFTEFVMSKLPEGPSRYMFFREGIPTLLDYSGRNYHHTANDFLVQGTIDPVEVLTTEAKFLELRPGMRAIESASLAGFIMWQWGAPKFMELYHSEDDFPDALEKVLGLNVGQLEDEWHKFLPEHTDEKEAQQNSQQQQAQPGGGS